MASGYERHQRQNEALGCLGRPLARRSGSKCELCGQGGVRLAPFEVEPALAEPSVDRALALCERCLEGVLGKRIDPQEWRFVETTAWSEILPAQVMAVRMLRRLAALKTDWAADALDNLYLSPEAEEWLEGRLPAEDAG